MVDASNMHVWHSENGRRKRMCGKAVMWIWNTSIPFTLLQTAKSKFNLSWFRFLSLRSDSEVSLISMFDWNGICLMKNKRGSFCYFLFFFRFPLVPSDPPSHMEALLLNSSAVYLKWKQPALQAHNGKCYLSAVYTLHYKISHYKPRPSSCTSCIWCASIWKMFQYKRN